MDFKVLAETLVPLVGGKENVDNVIHCMTRLRFTLKDESKADVKAIEVTKGVMSVVRQGGQFQIVIGNSVHKVYPEVLKVCGLKPEEESGEKKAEKKDSLFNSFFKTISSIIFPTVGVMISSGLIKGLLTLAVTFGVLTKQATTYTILYSLADSLLYFFPIILGFTAGKNFGANPIITAVLGATLVYPDIIALSSGKTAVTFMGIPVTMVNYTNSLFPILLGSYVASKIEKGIKKVIPDMLQLIFVPFLTLAIITPLTFIVIGPIMNLLSMGLSKAVMGIYGFSPILSGILLGAFWQVIVVLGLHGAFIPVLINNIVTTGHDPVNAIMGVSVFALAGAALGYSLKIKDKERKTAGFSSLASALCGVTEPVIYTIALPLKKPFVCAFIGGALGGAIVSGMGGAMYGMGGAGLFAGPMMVSPTNPMNIVAWAIASSVAFVVTAVLTFIVIKKEQ